MRLTPAQASLVKLQCQFLTPPRSSEQSTSIRASKLSTYIRSLTTSRPSRFAFFLRLPSIFSSSKLRPLITIRAPFPWPHASVALHRLPHTLLASPAAVVQAILESGKPSKPFRILVLGSPSFPSRIPCFSSRVWLLSKAHFHCLFPFPTVLKPHIFFPLRIHPSTLPTRACGLPYDSKSFAAVARVVKTYCLLYLAGWSSTDALVASVSVTRHSNPGHPGPSRHHPHDPKHTAGKRESRRHSENIETTCSSINPAVSE